MDRARDRLIDACSNCGADDWQVEEFGPLQRLWRWLQFGRPAPRARMTCRNCGTELLTNRKGGWAVLRRHRALEGWWGAPIRVLRVLVQGRTAVPVPWIYVAAAGAGTLLGVALDAAIGWPWWTVTLASVAAVWALFLMTAFTAAGRRMPQSLWADLRDAVDPGGAWPRWRRREAEAFRHSPFPLYGLPPSWEGPRFLGGMGWGGMGEEAGLNRLELAHGNPQDPDGIELRVSSAIPRGEPDLPWALVLRHLAEDLWREQDRPPQDSPPERFPEWAEAHERDLRGRETPPFTPVDVPLDGQPIRFDYLSDGPAWVAACRRDALTITLRARSLRVDAVELITVKDVEPYIEGSRRLDKRWQSGHE